LLIEINHQEIKALTGDYNDFAPGDEFMDYHHEYSYDLDIFGKHSIFRMLNRTATPLGKIRLAEHLKNPVSDSRITREKQQAVRELAPDVSWRQEFLATAREADWEQGKALKIADWLIAPDHFSNSRFYHYLTILNPFLTILVISLSFFRLLPFAFLLYLLIPAAVVLFQTRLINREQDRVERLIELFRKYQGLLELIENKEFKADRLISLRQTLSQNDIWASEIMKKLNTLLWGLEVRGNMLVAGILNLFFLWDIVLMMRLERWRKTHGKEFEKWISTIAEFESLNSMGNFAANQPNPHWPEILDGPFRMSLIGAGHPLIDPARRVDNSLEFNESGQIFLITGANMAGKSTLLRMVGVNMVLAMCGGPVCASSMKMSPVGIISSVRTNDSLGDDESYFYAELKKLNRIITALENKEPHFVIIDEMLKGTNSRDKHEGSAALIRKLISLGASGLVATHDVELGSLEQEYPDKIQNRCFEVLIESNQLKFDYILRPGISKSLNATFLMKNMGIISE
jgi:DNA mismatch repair ATPase MutS